jgi:diguanylate cyclase (GGDEF)-like protein
VSPVRNADEPAASHLTRRDLLAQIDSLTRALSEADQRAGIDPLTGLANRRWFTAALAMAEGRAQRDGIGVGIVMLDLDGLKAINDRDGHEAGDGHLLLTAQVLSRAARIDDIPARLGGDEFAVLVHADQDGVQAAADRLQEMLTAAGVAASIGWAMRAGREGLEEAMHAADVHLSAVKDATHGRRPSTLTYQESARTAIAAQVGQAQAVGILMHRQHCNAEAAQLEIAYQAFKLGLTVNELSALLIAIATGTPLHGEDQERGRDLVASLAQLTVPPNPPSAGGPTDGPGRARLPAGGGLAVNGAPPHHTAERAHTSATLTLLPRDAAHAARDVLVAGRYLPADRHSGGGDWIDTFMLPDGDLALVVGDVSGHGAEAARAMAEMRTLLRALAVDRNVQPSHILQRLDRCVTALHVDLMTTLIFARLSTAADGTVELHWTNAGHLPPLLLREDGTSTVLPGTDDLLIGLGPGAARHDLSTPIPASSTLLLFTDGLIETRTTDLDDGVARLQAAAHLHAPLDVTALSDQLVHTMVGDHPTDDVTLLALRTPPPAADR